MHRLRRIAVALLPLAQWVIYEVTFVVGFTCSLAVLALGLSVIFGDEGWQNFLRVHWIASLLLFMGLNVVSVTLLFLVWHLGRRWPHVTLP